jgi:hypothetical protein
MVSRKGAKEVRKRFHAAAWRPRRRGSGESALRSWRRCEKFCRRAGLVGAGAVEDEATEGVAGERLVAEVGEAEDDAVGVADDELLAVGLELDVPVVGVDAAAVEDDETFVVVDFPDRADPLDDLAAEEPVEALLRDRYAVGAAVEDGFGVEVIGGARRWCGRSRSGSGCGG